MFRLLNPVPGIENDPSSPDGRALSVNWMGPSRIDLVNDLMPRSVMLTPAIVLSKLKAERSVITRIGFGQCKSQLKVFILIFVFGVVTGFKSTRANNVVLDGFS